MERVATNVDNGYWGPIVTAIFNSRLTWKIDFDAFIFDAESRSDISNVVTYPDDC